MTFLAFLFILISLVTFVAAQLILKKAMEFSATHGMRNSYFISRVAIGFATNAKPKTTSAMPHQRNVEISSPRKIQHPSGTRISTTRESG